MDITDSKIYLDYISTFGYHIEQMLKAKGVKKYENRNYLLEVLDYYEIVKRVKKDLPAGTEFLNDELETLFMYSDTVDLIIFLYSMRKFLKGLARKDKRKSIPAAEVQCAGKQDYNNAGEEEALPGCTEQKKFSVYCEDNFQVQGRKQRDHVDDFDTYDEAVDCCRKIIDVFLIDYYTDNLHDNPTPFDLYDNYAGFGPDPFVMCGMKDREYHFWANEYAKMRSKEICRNKGGKDVDALSY